MNIILASNDDVAELRNKYTILELDTIKASNTDISQTAWCVITTDNTTIQNIALLQSYQDLHANLLKNYKLKNWKFCEDAIEHLVGQWNGELDSFYNSLTMRINKFKENDPGPDWNGHVAN